jgi:hypothetical protein
VTFGAGYAIASASCTLAVPLAVITQAATTTWSVCSATAAIVHLEPYGLPQLSLPESSRRCGVGPAVSDAYCAYCVVSSSRMGWPPGPVGSG